METKQTILVIEDEENIRHLVESVLTMNGFIVTSVDSAEKGLQRIPSLNPSLVLLDIQLPGMDGLECCKEIRADPQSKDVPIIFISVHSSEVYKIIGLESGADDFITKPFGHGELLARVKAVLRRTQRLKSARQLILKDDLFSLNLETRTASTHKGNKLKLTPKEFALLSLFLKSQGKVLTRDVLSSQVWGHENLATSRTIDVHIARLRRRLGKQGRIIETVGKVGYRYNP